MSQTCRASLDELNHDIAQQKNADRLEHYQEELNQASIQEKFDDDGYLADQLVSEEALEMIRDLRSMIPERNAYGNGERVDSSYDITYMQAGLIATKAIKLINHIEDKLGEIE